MKREMFFDGNEVDTDEKISMVKGTLNEKYGIIRRIVKREKIPQKPKISTYIGFPTVHIFFSDASLRDYNGSGTSINEKIAFLKAFAECFERYSCTVYSKEKLIKGSYENLKENALNPRKISYFTKKQLTKKEFNKYRIKSNDVFHWVKGFSLTSNKEILVPAHLVYWNYTNENEKMLMEPISTGAAAGTTYSAAIIRGILEIIERDAFMITYLNKIERCRIVFSKVENEELKLLLKEIKKYGFEFYVFDISTNLKVHSFLSFIIDKSLIPPLITSGLKSDLDPEKGILGSLEECFNTYDWVLELHKSGQVFTGDKNDIRSHNDRALYWLQKGMIKNLDFLIKTKKKKEISKFVNLDKKSTNENLEFLLHDLKKRKMETVIVDVTPRDVKEVGFKVVKVLIPKLQPLYLNEKIRYLGGKRLYKIPKLLGLNRKITEEDFNNIPHPFV